MKILRLLPVALISVMLAGCVGMKLPPNSCESATFSLTVGPFFSQHATLSGVSKVGDYYKVANFDGSTSYLGVVTTNQTAHDLTVGTPPAVPAAAVAVPAPSK